MESVGAAQRRAAVQRGGSAAVRQCGGGTCCQTARMSSGSFRHSAIGSAAPNSSRDTAVATAAGVVLSSSLQGGSG